MRWNAAWASSCSIAAPRRLSLTEAGGNYLEACQRILPEIDEAEASVASQRVEATGLLRMNVP